MYDLGIIGGLGPIASTEFYNNILCFTKEMSNLQDFQEQNHFNVVLLSIPQTLNRSSNIFEHTPPPVYFISKAINDLKKLGVSRVAIPCNTAHRFINEIDFPVGMRFYNIINIISDYISELELDNILILGTSGLRNSNLYGEKFKNLNYYYPSSEDQIFIDRIIYEVKKGIVKEEQTNKVIEIYENIRNTYGLNQLNILFGCTELTVFANSDNYIKNRIIDSNKIYAQSIVQDLLTMKSLDV